MMDEYVNSKESSYSRVSSFGKSTTSTDSCTETNSSCCSSPETPTSVLGNFRNSKRKSSEKENVENVSCSSPLLWSLRVQAVEKLNPIDVKHLLLPKLSHCGVNVCPSPNAVAIVEEPMIDVNDKLTSKKIDDVADENEEMEVSVTNDEHDLSREASPKADTNEEMEVSDIKEEKLILSRVASQEKIVEITSDIDSQCAATVEELPAAQSPKVASKPSPSLPPVVPPPPPPPARTPQPSIVALQLPPPPTFPPPPPPPPPMMQRSVVTAQQLPQPPPPPPMPEIKALPVLAAPMVPPPPPPPSMVIATVIKVVVPPPPPTKVTLTTITSAVPPPPPMIPLKGAATLAAPPPMPQGNGLAPPPPPPGGAFRSLRPKKASTKLKRSQQLGNLYRTLKGKVEGSNQNLKSAHGRKGGTGSSTGGKQGMADALAEMTKRYELPFYKVHNKCNRISILCIHTPINILKET